MWYAKHVKIYWADVLSVSPSSERKSFWKQPMHFENTTFFFVSSGVNNTLVCNYDGRAFPKVSCSLYLFIYLFIYYWCVYDKDHTSALRIKNTSESDPRSYEVVYLLLLFSVPHSRHSFTFFRTGNSPQSPPFAREQCSTAVAFFFVFLRWWAGLTEFYWTHRAVAPGWFQRISPLNWTK